jgi:hypothetical protein
MLDRADRLALHVLLHLYGTSSTTEPRSGSEIGVGVSPAWIGTVTPRIGRSRRARSG